MYVIRELVYAFDVPAITHISLFLFLAPLVHRLVPFVAINVVEYTPMAAADRYESHISII